MNTTLWQAALSVPVSPARDHIRGPVDAPLSLVEYGDYECPYCGAAQPILNGIMTQMGTELRFVFRHFPMSTVHPHAERAAEAAEAAGVQGKFWAMHDVLFRSQQQLEDRHLYAYAEALALDLVQFDEQLREGTHAERIREDFMSGVRSGVNGTPTFYINGVRHDGPYDFASLLAAIEDHARAQLGV